MRFAKDEVQFIFKNIILFKYILNWYLNDLLKTLRDIV